jgi:hypothetical protein
MASYKVLQDIEAEDTLVGPLTLRQCIYAGIAIAGIWLSYVVISRGAPYLAVIFFPFIAGGFFFAFPWSKQQSTEVWALAKIRFYLKPRTRIWNQSGVKQLVTITAPKRAPKAYRHHLTPDEVQSRLRALADTIDSRGWAVKNIELGYYAQPTLRGESDSDRLVDPLTMPQDVPNLDPAAAADIFDTDNNPVAHKFDTLMAQSAGAHHQQLVKQMDAPPAAPLTQYWHMKTIQPPGHDGGHARQPIDQAATAGQSHTYTPRPVQGYTSRQIQPTTPVDYAAIRTPGAETSAPLSSPVQTTMPGNYTGQSATQSVTDQPDPAILELANNNDLNVATIAREAQARTAGPNDEVVVSLH